MNTKHLFKSGITIGGPGLDAEALRDFAKNHPEEFMGKIQGEIDSGKFSWRSVGDLRRLQERLSGIELEVQETLPGGSTRAVMSSAFPLLSGQLTQAGIQAAYDSVQTIGQDLVTDIEDPKAVTTMASIHAMDVEVEKVAENDEFPEINASEEKVEIRSLRNGRKLTVTQEVIDRNDVADIINRINALGQIASDRVEEQTLRRVFDIDGSDASSAEPYVYRPAGAGTQLYNSTANNPGTRAPSGTRVDNNALVDETDLEAVRAVLANMRNNRGKRIASSINQMQIVVPDALTGVTAKLLGSELQPGVENELNNWGPRGMWRPRPISSPKIDDLSTTAWYMGDFKKQFVRKWALRMENVTLSGASTQEFLNRRIAFQARIAWDVEIGALDYVFVVQSLSGTTAPVA